MVDSYNNRILEFQPPFTNGEPASLVLGSDSFTVTTRTLNQSSLGFSTDLAFDSSGNLWVTDDGHNRVVEFQKGAGFSNGQAASLVLGQPDFSHDAAASTDTGMFFPSGLAFDSSGNLWVADTGNNRILKFLKGAGFTDGEAASVVIGQSTFGTSTSAISQTGLNQPYGLAFDKAGNLWVADSENNRVLRYDSPFMDGEGASLVIGATGYTDSIDATQQNGLVVPRALAFDSAGNLLVADPGNNRVIEFPFPQSTDEDGNLVLGQTELYNKLSCINFGWSKCSKLACGRCLRGHLGL